MHTAIVTINSFSPTKGRDLKPFYMVSVTTEDNRAWRTSATLYADTDKGEADRSAKGIAQTLGVKVTRKRGFSD